MEYDDHANLIKSMITHMTNERKILRPATFMKKLDFRLNARAQGCWGGIKNKIPVVNIGIKNHGRYTDRKQWLRHIRLTQHSARQKVWKEAYEHAQMERWMFIEYSHVHSKAEIGGFVHWDSDVHIGAITAHELSHAIDYWNRQCGNKCDDKPHGSEWQYLYKQLRREFVNPLI